MRPIIPCHSAIQNPAAKFVSKKLKPLIKGASTIIHGTKDLAIKLSKLSIDRRRRWYICTGDVVAYYPNIPIDKCISVVYQMWMDMEFGDGHNVNGPDWDLEKEEHRKFFLEALTVGNTELITRYKDIFYLQKKGLAMGVASSPDLANLYGAWFEKRCGILDDPRTIFYGRYIDDVFALVYADSELEAQTLCDKVVFDGCVIEWSCGDASPFLDMFLYRNAYNALEYKPYRKAGNHQERVPWVSHHPLDVKRGTYVGEMSRLATLCSSEEHYVEAVKGLAVLYTARGYPSDLVRQWTRLNMAKRWSSRLNENSVEHSAGSESDVLVLKSEFNTTWNYFNATELGKTVTEYWSEWLRRFDREDFNNDFPRNPRDDFGSVTSFDDEFALRRTTFNWVETTLDVRKLDILNRRWIVSRKRKRNLFDLTSLWKKTVLSHLDIDAQTEGTRQVPLESSDPEPAIDWAMVDLGRSDVTSAPQEGDLEWTAGPSVYIS